MCYLGMTISMCVLHCQSARCAINKFGIIHDDREDVKIFEILNLIEAKLEAKAVRKESEEAAAKNLETYVVSNIQAEDYG